MALMASELGSLNTINGSFSCGAFVAFCSCVVGLFNLGRSLRGQDGSSPCTFLLFWVTPWLLFAYFMLFRAWYVLSPPSSLGMEIGTWMAWRFWYYWYGASGTQWYAVVRVFLEYMDIDALKYARAPDPLWGSRGMAMAVAASARLALLLRSTSDAVPLVPVQIQSTERPATTVGESSRGGSL